MDMVRFIPDVEPKRVVGVLSETIDWGQKFMGVDAYRTNANTTGSGVKVAILDTGVDPNHPDLKPNLVDSVDFTGDARLLHGHASHVAGIAGAKADGVGIVGVAPDCSLYSVRVLDADGLCPGDYSWIIKGFEWSIDSKVDVINLSLGSPAEPPQELRSLILKAVNSGIIVVSAGGNEGQKQLNWPARYEEVISVAALDKNGKIATFSNVGDHLTTAAPGVDIYSTWVGGGYAQESGSSMSSPFVAGIVALMLSYHRNGGDHDTPLTNYREAIVHLNVFAQPGPLVTESGDPLNIGLLNFNQVIAKSMAQNHQVEAKLEGVSKWRVDLYGWLHSILRKVII